jgi:hypothetical protein
MREYRIVRDGYAGYEVQVRTKWWPFWRQPLTNTHSTIEAAERWARNHASSKTAGVARFQPKYLGRL